VERRLILVTGANGQLGRELLRRDWPDGWTVRGTDRTSLDIFDTSAISEIIHSEPWSLIINAAAYTAVDRAESDPADAWRANAVAPAVLGWACAQSDIPVIHISTDYVFSGSNAGPSMESDPVGPIGVYGASKLGGEIAIKTSGARYQIIRTAWLVSAHGQNFVKTMLRLASEKERIGVVDNQLGSPTSAADLAQAIGAVARQMLEAPAWESGILHFANSGSASWADFAAEIFQQSSARGGPAAEVDRISDSQFPTAAARPKNSVLSVEKYTKLIGSAPRPWQQALSDILDELIGKVR
jgi:dTDP-4-dehydrorhamnose reductase